MSNDIGIDLGTTTILVYKKGKGIVYNEPSVIAFDKKTSEPIAFGNRAKNMVGKNPDSIEIVKPLKDGVISDFQATEQLLKLILKKVSVGSFLAPNIMICVPSRVTEVEKNAVIDVAEATGARNVYLIEEPVAAALGAGIDIWQKQGHLIIDIGGGTTDIAVISEGTSLVKSSLNIAGNAFDDAIRNMLYRRFKLEVGTETAQKIKEKIGSCIFMDEPKTMVVSGKHSDTGFPLSIELDYVDTVSVLEPLAKKISNEVKSVLEKTPPEFLEDIEKNGVTLTGGGSLLNGLDTYITKNTNINTRIADDAKSCVVIGTGRAISDIRKIENKNKESNNYFETNRMRKNYFRGKNYEQDKKKDI